MRLAIAMLVLLTGCAQVLGLDETHAGGDDIEELPACGEPLECEPDEICGELFDLGTGASLGLAGTPRICAPGDDEAPCNLVVEVAGYPDLSGTALDVELERDSCGRFRIGAAPAGSQIYGVSVDGTSYEPTTTLITGADVAAGDHQDVRALAVRDTYFGTIGIQPNPRPWFAITLSPGGQAQAANALRRDGVEMQEGVEVYYFADLEADMRLQVDPSRPSTGANGTGMVINPNGVLSTGCDRALFDTIGFLDRTVVYYMHCDI